MAKEAEALKPKYAVGTVVSYTDRHGRKQTGRVRSIEGKWWLSGQAYLLYRLQHPTYQNGNFYCGEDDIHGVSHA